MKSERDKYCSKCSTSFICGGDCWCNEYPSIMSMSTESDCLCSDCLSASIKEKINDYLIELTATKIKKIQRLGLPDHLKEGIDYTVNKEGNWVFSPWYLLRQGKCCKNDCTNCPYSSKFTEFQD